MNEADARNKQHTEDIVWVQKPCDICDKPVTVMNTHEGPTWCLEHAGTWKEEAAHVVG